MSWYKPLNKSHGIGMALAWGGWALQIASVWLQGRTEQAIWWIGSGLMWTSVVLLVYFLYHEVGPGVRLSSWRKMRRLGWRWRAHSFYSPCGRREVRRVAPGVWAAVHWSLSSKTVYRGAECADPLAALLAGHLDNWGE